MSDDFFPKKSEHTDCVDQAVFPTVGSANPVLTGLVLARKIA